MIYSEVIQGDSITQSIQLKSKNTNLPLNLTGCTARCNIVDAKGTVLFSDLDIISNAAEGRISIVSPGSVTSNIPERQRLYSDVEITFPDGIVKTYAQTTHTVLKGYTNG